MVNPLAVPGGLGMEVPDVPCGAFDGRRYHSGTAAERIFRHCKLQTEHLSISFSCIFLSPRVGLNLVSSLVEYIQFPQGQCGPAQVPLPEPLMEASRVLTSGAWASRKGLMRPVGLACDDNHTSLVVAERFALHEVQETILQIV